MQDNDQDELFRKLRTHFNPPPEPPREEMWETIQARIARVAPGSSRGGDPVGTAPIAEDVLSLDKARSRRRGWAWTRKPSSWAAAAAAILVVGIGIGRMTAPVGDTEQMAAEVASDPNVMFAAAVNHLARTESLLTMVRADARTGRLEPGLATWSRSLLTQTRLLMDTEAGQDPVMADLLNDLELVLVQVLGAANAAPDGPDRARSELNLALEGMDENDVLPRLQAVIPAGPGYRGT